MNNLEISAALNLLPEEMLEEARLYKAPKRKNAIIKFAALAACAAIVIGLALPGTIPPMTAGDTAAPENAAPPPMPESETTTDTTGESVDIEYGYALPENYSPASPRPEYETVNGLPVLAPALGISGMGFEGLLAYDIADLSPTSPLADSDGISTLPVYRNPLWRDEQNTLCGLDWDLKYSALMEIAGYLGLDESEILLSDDSRSPEELEKLLESGGAVLPVDCLPITLVGETEDMRITVDPDMRVRAEFLEPVDLPDFGVGYASTYSDTVALAQYLLENYSHLLGLSNPQILITGGDYSFDGEQHHQIFFYDLGATDAETLYNRFFRSVQFTVDESGDLWFVAWQRSDTRQHLGDYPIISSADALAALGRGEYITTVPYDFPGAEYAARTELVYRVGSESGEDYMPYYRILVELPELETDTGLKTYGAYYVPAVAPEYLTAAELWNGSFN